MYIMFLAHSWDIYVCNSYCSTRSRSATHRHSCPNATIRVMDAWPAKMRAARQITA